MKDLWDNKGRYAAARTTKVWHHTWQPSAWDRFCRKTKWEGTCIVWTGRKNWGGYGQFSVRYSHVLVHRYAYEVLVGAIPTGLVIDHLCRNRACVNVNHLEVVTRAENNRRAYDYIFKIGTIHRGKAHCKHGHAFTPENTREEIDPIGGGVWRKCRKCGAARTKKYLDKKRGIS